MTGSGEIISSDVGTSALESKHGATILLHLSPSVYGSSIVHVTYQFHFRAIASTSRWLSSQHVRRISSCHTLYFVFSSTIMYCRQQSFGQFLSTQTELFDM